LNSDFKQDAALKQSGGEILN
jgi:hypothetical protein